MIPAIHFRLASLREAHRPLFWVLFTGELIASTGRFMVYPFFAIYVHERLGASLTTVGLLIAGSSLTGLLAQSVAGPLVDRFGRRGVLVVTLALDIAGLVAFAFANSLAMMAVLMLVFGLVGGIPSLAIGTMVADVTPSPRRQEAYGLLRIATNAGAAVGPAVGGFVAGVSYFWAFIIAATATLVYLLLIIFRTTETRPLVEATSEGDQASLGYGHLLRDGPFLAFCGASILMSLAYAIPWVLLSVHLKTNYRIPENMFGFLVTINALMVVFFQFPIARWLARFPKMPVMVAAALFYALGAGSIAFFDRYLLFVLSMVVITVGELLASPTASAYVADVAPLDMRGRYMAAFFLTWGIAFGVGPVLGGWLNDTFGPAAMWQGAMAFGLVSALAFLALGGLVRAIQPSAPAASEPIE